MGIIDTLLQIAEITQKWPLEIPEAIFSNEFIESCSRYFSTPNNVKIVRSFLFFRHLELFRIYLILINSNDFVPLLIFLRF